MNTKLNITKVVGICLISGLPIAAIAGGGQAWTQQTMGSQHAPHTVRDWAAIDLDRDNLITPQEMSSYLESVRAGKVPAQAESTSERIFSPLSSTDLGMHFSHGTGKDNPSLRIYLNEPNAQSEPGKEGSQNLGMNKKEQVLEIKEAAIKQPPKM